MRKIWQHTDPDDDTIRLVDTGGAYAFVIPQAEDLKQERGVYLSRDQLADLRNKINEALANGFGPPPPEPLRVGDVVHGYARGAFGPDHYACSRIEAMGADWVVVRGVSTGKVAVGAGEDVVDLLTGARDSDRGVWCRDPEGCGEEPGNA